MKTVAIIQARMGSTRFPGKILKKINGTPVLKHMINRLNYSHSIDEIVIATTPSSYEIHDFCNTNEIKMYVGSEDDVLQRVYHCALTYHADIIVDLTSDCPLVDPDHIDQLVTMIKNDSGDYASNINPRLMFDGADIQAYTRSVLHSLNEIVKHPNYRQHSGFNAIISSQFDTTLSIKPSSVRYIMPDIALTLDYPEDLDTIANVMNHFGDRYYSYEEICNFIIANPEVLTNSHCRRKKPGE